MAASIIPPGYVNTPAQFVYSDVPAPVLMTYIQLRGFAWSTNYKQTPPLRFEEIAELTHKKRQTIYEHVHALQNLHWLLSSEAGHGAYVFIFPAVPDLSKISESPLLTPNSTQSQSSANHEDINKSGMSKISDTKRDPNLDHPAVKAFRAFMHLTANELQRKMIVATVKDNDAWDDCLNHWRGHGYSPTNVTGMLDSYTQGGRKACAYCRKHGKTNGNGHQPAVNAQVADPNSPEAIAERRKYITGVYAEYIEH